MSLRLPDAEVVFSKAYHDADVLTISLVFKVRSILLSCLRLYAIRHFGRLTSIVRMSVKSDTLTAKTYTTLRRMPIEISTIDQISPLN